MDSKVWAGRPAAAILLCALAGSAGIWNLDSAQPEPLELSEPMLEYIGARGPFRPFRMRLSGPWRYAPDGSSSVERPGLPGLADAGTRRLILLEDRIRREAEQSATLPARASWATLLLLRSRTQDAISAYLELIRESGPRAALLNDLAVAYYVQGTAGERFSRLLDCLGALEQAAAGPAPAAVLFNRVLALEAVHLRRAAAQAAREYEALDDLEEWRSELRSRRTTFEREEGFVGWTDRFEIALAASDPEVLRGEVRRSPSYARRYASEHLLHGWARSIRDGSSGEAWLRAAARIAAEISSCCGDPLLDEAVRAIESIPAQRRAGLAAGLDAYAEGVKQVWEEGGSPEACQKIARSVPLLTGNSLQWWARVEEAVCLVRQGMDPRIVPISSSVLEATEGRPYHELRGRALWIRGLAAIRAGRTLKALSDYRQALRSFETYGDGEQMASMYRQLADGARSFHDRESAWNHQLRAWAILSESSDRQRRYANLMEIAGAALLEGRALPALKFHQQASHYASSWNLPELHRWGAAIRHSLGQPSRARRELFLGYQSARQLPESQRAIHEAALAITEADLDVPSESRLQRALDHLTILDYGTGIADVRLRLARLWRARGEWERSLRALTHAISALEERYDSLDSSESPVENAALQRAQFLPALDQLYGEAVMVANDLGAPPQAALDLVERARHRAFAVPAASRRVAAPVSVQRLVGQIPEDATILVCSRLGAKLLVWTLDREGVAHRTFPAPTSAASFDGATGAMDRTTAAELFDVLIRPVAGLLRRRLVFVPDSELSAIPFGLLLDGEVGRFLVEDHEVATAPTVDRAVAALRSDDRVQLAGALCVGDPAFDARLFPRTSRLPAAGDEARAACAGIPQSETLTGEAAVGAELVTRLPRVPAFFFAGHAVPLDGGAALLLAPAAADDPGAVTSTDLARLELSRLRLAFLSACRAGSAGPAISLGPLGIAQGFLRQGTPFVVASLWPIGDRDASPLLALFIENLKDGEGVFAAFQKAQISAVSRYRGSGLPAWAGLQLLVSKEAES